MRCAVWLGVVASLAASACAAGEGTAARRPPSPAQRVVRAPPTPIWTRESAFVAAVHATERGDCARALRTLERLLGRYSPLEDHILYFLADCAARGGDLTRASAAWSDLLADHRDSIHVPEANLAWGTALREHGRTDEAKVLLKRAGDSSDSRIARRAKIELARIEMARGNLRRAERDLYAVRKADRGGPAGREARTTLGELWRRAPNLAPTTEAERRAEADQLTTEAEYGAALRIVNGLLITTPPSRHPSLLMKRAEIEKAGDDRSRMAATYRDVHTRFPGTSEAIEAYYQEARHHWNRDSDEVASRMFRTYLERYPGSKRAPSIRYALARIEQTAGNNAAAIAGFQNILRTYPRSRLAREAKWHIAWIHYREGRFNDAARDIARFARGLSFARAERFHYWHARSLEQAGRVVEARQIYDKLIERVPRSYYALLARRRLGLERRAVAPPAHTIASHFPAPPAGLPHDGHLERSRELHALGLRELALRELRAYERRRPRTAVAREHLVRAYPAVGGYRRAIQLAGTRVERPTVQYPLAFWSAMREESTRHELDPWLVLSLVRQESYFDPAARSPADARGLMQLLPSTAATTARNIGWTSGIDLYDPNTNIRLGTAHLAELAERYGDNSIRMLAAYNAGADAVAKWDSRFLGLPPDEYVESITYTETRNYVKKILVNLDRYREIYGQRIVDSG